MSEIESQSNSSQVKKEDQKQINQVQYQDDQSQVLNKTDLSLKTISLIIYAGNLPLSWNQNDIFKFFQQYGIILEVRLIRKSFGFTGSALVKFKSLTEAQNAIQHLKNTIIPGASRPINIKWLDTQQQRLGIGQNDQHKLFVGSLPRQASRQTLYEVFSLLGDIETIRLQDTQFWAFVDYRKKQSALLAIKHLNGQTYLHGSRIPIEVRFKQKKYNSYMSKKHAEQDLDPFAYSIANVYYEVWPSEGERYFYNYATQKSQYQSPPPGAKVYTSQLNDQWYIMQQTNQLNDMQSSTRKLGPPGSNLFLFHLPNNMKDSELYNLFKPFGNILSTRVMTEKNGKSKGIGFVSFDNPKSAQQAIQEMNSFEIRGKRLKVELNKKDEKCYTNQISSLRQADWNPI